MNPETAPSKTGFAGAKSVWDDLQVAHVAQVQFIHTVVYHCHHLFGKLSLILCRRVHSFLGIAGT